SQDVLAGGGVHEIHGEVPEPGVRIDVGRPPRQGDDVHPVGQKAFDRGLPDDARGASHQNRHDASPGTRRVFIRPAGPSPKTRPGASRTGTTSLTRASRGSPAVPMRFTARAMWSPV